RQIMVDRASRNRENAGDAGERLCRQNEEHDNRSEQPGRTSDNHGRDGIAGVIEGLVAADAACKAPCPTTPRAVAAIAGGKMLPAACATPCETATGQKLGNSGSESEAIVTII